jgi:hypothetical protein
MGPAKPGPFSCSGLTAPQTIHNQPKANQPASNSRFAQNQYNKDMPIARLISATDRQDLSYWLLASVPEHPTASSGH